MLMPTTRTSQGSSVARPRKPAIELPPYVQCVRVKGRPYYYLQIGRGTACARKRVRLPDDPRQTEFWTAYRQAMGQPESQRPTDSFETLIERFKAAPEWAQLSESTKRNWSLYLGRIQEMWGDLQVQGVQPKHVLALRDKFAATPAAANNLLRCLSSMLSWSVPRGWRPDNPCLLVPKLKGGDAYAPWPWELILLAKTHLRSELWFALALALYTGQRLGDVLAMRWDSVVGNMIVVTQEKTRRRLAIPLHAELQAVLPRIPKNAVTILSTSAGAPWTKDGFQSSWQKAFDEPKGFGAEDHPWPLKPIREGGFVFHGLRKSAVVFLLEAGCSDAEVSSITGQSRQMVEHYGRQVNQRKLATTAILKWERSDGDVGSGTS
jgi:integrase